MYVECTQSVCRVYAEYTVECTVESTVEEEEEEADRVSVRECKLRNTLYLFHIHIMLLYRVLNLYIPKI